MAEQSLHVLLDLIDKNERPGESVFSTGRI